MFDNHFFKLKFYTFFGNKILDGFRVQFYTNFTYQYRIEYQFYQFKYRFKTFSQWNFLAKITNLYLYIRF